MTDLDPIPPYIDPSTGAIGKAGELIVASRLLLSGYRVSFPAVDEGADLLVHTDDGRTIKVQCKTASRPSFALERSWFGPKGDYVVVWTIVRPFLRDGRCFVFRGVADAEQWLGPRQHTTSWAERGRYMISSAQFGSRHMKSLEMFEEAFRDLTLPAGGSVRELLAILGDRMVPAPDHWHRWWQSISAGRAPQQSLVPLILGGDCAQISEKQDRLVRELYWLHSVGRLEPAIEGLLSIPETEWQRGPAGPLDVMAADEA